MNKTSQIILIFLFTNLCFTQNGKILSKRLVDITKTPIWRGISQDNELHSNFEHLNNLDFYFITYLSDSVKVRGIVVEPKTKGKYPVILKTHEPSPLGLFASWPWMSRDTTRLVGITVLLVLLVLLLFISSLSLEEQL